MANLESICNEGKRMSLKRPREEVDEEFATDETKKSNAQEMEKKVSDAGKNNKNGTKSTEGVEKSSESETSLVQRKILVKVVKRYKEMDDDKRKKDPSLPNAEGICYFLNLPDEVIIKILKQRINRFTYNSDLINSGQTCPRFRRIVRSSLFWSKFPDLILRIYAKERCIMNSQYFPRNFVNVLRQMLEHNVTIKSVKLECRYGGMTDVELFRFCVLLVQYKERFKVTNLNVMVTKNENLSKILSCLEVGMDLRSVRELRLCTDVMGDHSIIWKFMHNLANLRCLSIEVDCFDASSVRKLSKTLSDMPELEQVVLTNYTGIENTTERALAPNTTLNEFFALTQGNLKSVSLLRQHLMNTHTGGFLELDVPIFNTRFEGKLETLILHVEPMWFRTNSEMHVACCGIVRTFPKLVTLRLVSHIFQNPMSDVQCLQRMITNIVQDMSIEEKAEFTVKFLFEEELIDELMTGLRKLFNKITTKPGHEYICEFDKRRIIISARCSNRCVRFVDV